MNDNGLDIAREGLEESIIKRLILISHLWPGVHYGSVWDLPWFVWVGYARAHDTYVREQKEANR